MKCIKAFGQTDVGLMRTINQDSIFISTKPVGRLPNLFIVADGMGGHKAGDVASREAIDRFIRYAKNTHMSEPSNILDAGIISINSDIYQMAESNKDYNGMGTTFVACTIKDDTLYVANVGDSRLYIINRGIEQITKDHSVVEDMVRMGIITHEEARKHYKKNMITKAIGVADTNQSNPDIFRVKLLEGDKVLLCSDGLTNMVTDDEIKKIVSENTGLELTVSKLIGEANENGGKDNISAVLVVPLQS